MGIEKTLKQHENSHSSKENERAQGEKVKEEKKTSVDDSEAGTHIFFSLAKKSKTETEIGGERSKNAGITLTATYLSSKVLIDKQKGFDSITVLKLSGQNIVKCDDLSYCQFLQRVELNNNSLKNIKFLQDNTDLNYIDISHNQIDSLYPLKSLKKLKILKASNNEIKTISSDLLHGWSDTLTALIASHNQISQFPVPPVKMKHLNTLVLGNNKISELKNLINYPNLRKLSVSFNSIRSIPGNEIQELKQLKEFRIAHNKILTIPNEISFASSLEVLIINANFIKNIAMIENLKPCTQLKTLNCKDNPLSKEDQYRERIIGILPNLQFLDDQPLVETRKQRNKKKREERRKQIIAERKRNFKQMNTNETEEQETSHTETQSQQKNKEIEISSSSPSQFEFTPQAQAPTQVVIQKLIPENEQENQNEFKKRKLIHNTNGSSTVENNGAMGTFVNLIEEKEKKKLDQQLKGGYVERNENFSGVVKMVSMKPNRKKNTKSVFDILQSDV